MKRLRNLFDTAHEDLDAVLAKMSVEALREIVHEMLGELDERARARFIATLIARAARGSSGWEPAAVSDAQVAEVLAFVQGAKRMGRAEPSDVDERLRIGLTAFVGKNYESAQRVFGALLPPICQGEIDLGQDELADEVLGSDLTGCATQYVVSVYMTYPAAERADAVLAAINLVREIGPFWEPLREMERVAVEPLPDIKDFLPRWRSVIVNRSKRERAGDWDTTEDRWLREVVQYLKAQTAWPSSLDRRGEPMTFAHGAEVSAMPATGRLLERHSKRPPDWLPTIAMCEANSSTVQHSPPRASVARICLRTSSGHGAQARVCRVCAAGSVRPTTPRPSSE